MRLDLLLQDATGDGPWTGSQLAQDIKLAALLTDKHGAGSLSPKGVAKWFERRSIPGPWLMKIAALPKKPLNLADYA
jgi:hypothetical protein